MSCTTCERASDRQSLQPDYLYQFLLDPEAVVPGTPMRNMDLWEDEARALVRHLQALRKTATSKNQEIEPEAY